MLSALRAALSERAGVALAPAKRLARRVFISWHGRCHFSRRSRLRRCAIDHNICDLLRRLEVFPSGRASFHDGSQQFFVRLAARAASFVDCNFPGSSTIRYSFDLRSALVEAASAIAN